MSKLADMFGATAKEGYVKGSAFFSGKPEELIRQAVNDRDLAATSLSERMVLLKTLVSLLRTNIKHIENEPTRVF